MSMAGPAVGATMSGESGWGPQETALSFKRFLQSSTKMAAISGQTGNALANSPPGPLPPAPSVTAIAAMQVSRELPAPVWQVLLPRVQPPAWHSDKDIPKKYDVSLIGERGIGHGLNFYSIDKEMALGKQLSQEVESRAKLFNDPVVDEYINRIGQKLVRNSDARVPFTIKVVDSDEINAFALPGGYFYVNLGLIEAADSEAELAGAMAHEIAHVAARHATKRATKHEIWDLATIPLVFVGGPVGVAVRNFAGLAVPLSFLKFGRDDEREADLLGLEYMYACGYDPEAFVDFFDKLAAKEKKHKNFIARAFASHPMTGDRVKRSEKEIEELLPPKQDYLVTTSDFDRVKARIEMLTRGRLMLGKQSQQPVLRTRQ